MAESQKSPIAETQPLLPLQGIHKTAAEHHYRIAADCFDTIISAVWRQRRNETKIAPRVR